MSRTSLHRDDGFSLSELLVVIGLMGIVMSAAYLSYSVAANGSRAAERESMIAREIAAPLLECERLLIQQHNILTGSLETRIVNPGPYLVAFNTDRDHDSHIESNIIEATADGRLVISRSETTEHGLQEVVWSTENHNRAAGVPLLTFYDGSGAAITDSNAIASDARGVKITIVTEYYDHQYRDSRTATFRNR